jgi:phosphotriesterase-related protein
VSGAALVVPTVLGELEAAELGRTNAHEHLIMRDPVLAGEELDDVDRSAAELASLRDSGFDAVLELTPIGLGRDPRGLAELSRRTGVHVVMATGVHHEDHYPAGHPLRDEGVDRLTARFTADLRTGADGTDIRAGVIKVGTGYWRISRFERRALEAAGAAHAATGAPVVCHLERGTAAFEVLAVLEQSGAPADRVLLAHVDRNPDPGLHGELAATGAALGYDGWGRAKYWPDSVLLECLLAAAERGARTRILLGGDVARRSAFRAYGGMPGMAYLGERVIPRLRALGGDALVEDLLVANPRRLLARGRAS